jgi:hypothetical protein
VVGGVGKRLVSINNLRHKNERSVGQHLSEPVLPVVQLVPEFIQEAASAEAVAAAALRLLWNEGDARDKVLLGYQRLNARLGGPGAAGKAAAIILQTISPRANYVDPVKTSVR